MWHPNTIWRQVPSSNGGSTRCIKVRTRSCTLTYQVCSIHTAAFNPGRAVTAHCCTNERGCSVHACKRLRHSPSPAHVQAHLPCAQQKHSSVCPSCCTSATHCSLLSNVPNMMALLQALLLSTRTTPGGGWCAEPPVSSSWCRYSCRAPCTTVDRKVSNECVPETLAKARLVVGLHCMQASFNAAGNKLMSSSRLTTQLMYTKRLTTHLQRTCRSNVPS
jgi:hypothetical protein